ncbi:MAG TPA: DNA-binding domain-containing protein [Silvibacterium sp.]|nr:DNA-binding domain-containing protein [Silvibacterium sp.]
MSGLLELQRRVAAAILHPLTRSETMPRRRRDGASNQREAEALIRPNDRLSSFERLEIYNRQYWFRLYSAFEEDFPGLKAVIGNAKFETLMRDYLTECPSTSFTLRNLGSRLEEWLLAHPEHLEPRRQLAMDMARLEWAHIEAFDSGEEELLDPDDLMDIDDDSRIRLQPHLRVLELHYPVDDLLIQLRSEDGSGDASSNNASVARTTKHVRRVTMLEPEEIFVAVHRHANTVYYKRMHGEDYRLLKALLGGEPLGRAIELAFEGSALADEEREKFLQSAFALWAKMGWFTRQISN